MVRLSAALLAWGESGDFSPVGALPYSSVPDAGSVEAGAPPACLMTARAAVTAQATCRVAQDHERLSIDAGPSVQLLISESPTTPSNAMFVSLGFVGKPGIGLQPGRSYGAAASVIEGAAH